MRTAVLNRIVGLAMLAAIAVNPGQQINAQPISNFGDPAAAALIYSGMEASGQFELLYRYMHPDAQTVVPMNAVIGWYQQDFAPRGPKPITVTGVHMRSWTWEVTGATYPITAEVAYTQPFADGSLVSDVVRLVEWEGEWRWFFGRSRAFVDEQITRFGAESGSGSNHMPSLDSGSATSANPAGSSVERPSHQVTHGPTPILSTEQILTAPVLVDEIPPGAAVGGKEIAPNGPADGPLFGTMNDSLGATWITVTLTAPSTHNIKTFLLQYAVFPSTHDAESAFWRPTFQARLGTPPLGSYKVPIQIASSSVTPAVGWWSDSTSQSAGAGIAALSGNVIIVVSTSEMGLGFNSSPLAPSLDTVKVDAYTLMVGSILHLDRLRA